MLAADTTGYLLVMVPSGVIVAAIGWIFWRERQSRRRDNGR